MQAPHNISFTRFIFVVPRRDNEAFLTRLRAAGGVAARGFFNDFDADGTRDAPPTETIQFLVADGEPPPESSIAAARYVVQVTARYRSRLGEVESDLRRRLSDLAALVSLEGAERAPRYTSPELHDFAYRPAAVRRGGHQAASAIILPVNKSGDWWRQPALERHAFFYPHVDAVTGCAVPGHARAAEEGIAVLHRRLYHNPDGYQRAGEYDFVTYFECEPHQVDVFDRVHTALRDTARNPEWRYVMEGPLWKGRRVLKW